MDICKISAYLPCRGSREGETEFDNTLLHANTHHLVIAADFNTDLLNPSPRSTKVTNELDRFQMSLFDCPRGNTFHHYNELSASQIDFIVGSRQLNLKIQALESSPQKYLYSYTSQGIVDLILYHTMYHPHLVWHYVAPNMRDTYRRVPTHFSPTGKIYQEQCRSHMPPLSYWH